jgi:hypothetical protein
MENRKSIFHSIVADDFYKHIHGQPPSESIQPAVLLLHRIISALPDSGKQKLRQSA